MNEMHHLILLVLAVGLPNNIKAADMYQYKVALSNITHVLESNQVFIKADSDSAESPIYFRDQTKYGTLYFNSVVRMSSTGNVADEDTGIEFCKVDEYEGELLYAATTVIQQILTGGQKCPIKRGQAVSFVTEKSEQFSLERTDCTSYDLRVKVMKNRESAEQLNVFAKVDVSGDETACNPNSP